MDNAYVIITGAAGFIGSNLLGYLLEHSNYHIIGIDNLSTGNIDNLKEFEGNSRFKFVECDITDKETLTPLFQKAQALVHLAALGSVPRSIDNPLATNFNNVQGSLSVFFTAKEAGIKKIIYASSSSVYGDNDDLIKIEERIGKHLSPYAISKYAGELYAANFSELYGQHYLGLRFFNVFGPKQNPNGAYAAVVPKFIQKILANQQPTINGDGENSRDFTYVYNVCYSILLGLTADWNGNHVVNVSCGGSFSINHLYKRLQEILGFEQNAIHGEKRLGDIQNSCANIDKVYDLLGYKPQIDFEEGLRRTVSYFKRSL